MSHLSLLLVLAGLSAAPAPQDPSPGPQPAQADQKRGYGGIVGSQDPRFMLRSEAPKILGEFGGKSLLDAWRGTWLWVTKQTPGEDVLLASEDGRGVALNALSALMVSGNGTGIRSGAMFRQYRVLTRTLRAQQGEDGLYVAADAPEAALDQALVVLCIAEATIGHPVEALLEHNQKGADALLALRGDDGLWHAGEAVDPVVTGVAAYALYTATAAGAQVAPAAFEAIAAWTDAAEIGDDATANAATLVARIYAGQALERGLKDDARVRALLVALDPALPQPGDDAKPASDGQMQDNGFAFLASVALVQADNVRWNRLFTWVAEHLVADTGAEPTGALLFEANDGVPAGDNGRFPESALASAALRVLQLQSSFREPALEAFAN